MTRERPNIVFIIMDDLTWGDLACHGNPVVNTPNLDRLHAQSVRLEQYRSGPVCTPARASVMTGRYPFRTRAIDTYCGRSMMDPEEVTLAELLRDAGYRTCISGKWHLGDCYPMRAMDKGFEEALVHNGGGLRQPANVTYNNGYFDPDLMHNGQVESSEGYCTDIFTEHGLQFVEDHRDEPFFLYLATNAPHCPFEIGDEWAAPYLAKGVNETHAKIYGMVENIDMNVGRVMAKLDELGLAEDTILVYTSDHGWCSSSLHEGGSRFNADLRGGKGSVYDGGMRVPCFWRWPKRFAADVAIDRIANPIDIMPTLLAAAGIPPPADVTIDGIDLLPLLSGETDPRAWPDREIFLQWHRGEAPERYRNFAALDQRYKLCRPDFLADDGTNEQLYDLEADPAESRDIIADHPDVAKRLRAAYDRWFDDVSSTRGAATFDAPRIHLGTEHESPTVLTRQDWRTGDVDNWNDDARAHWETLATRAGSYIMTLRFGKIASPGEAQLRCGSRQYSTPIAAGDASCTFDNVELTSGPLEISAWLELPNAYQATRYIDVAHSG